ncbi:LCP family protein [Frondihabitans cladoniiphilus]|uniref:Cell envelope-related transcriptional attenuator domain-containing protein n=1 Tax=Frondihabitans cladoniiphilus TaxID=715785 RepID=A0ABP8W408_9MICO
MSDRSDRLPTPAPDAPKRPRGPRSRRRSDGSGSASPALPLAPAARHGRLRRGRATAFVLKYVAVAVAVLLVSGVSVGAIAVHRLTSQLGPGVALQGEKTQIAKAKDDNIVTGVGAYDGGFNVLIVGTDNDAKQGDAFGVRDATLNDVNILLHVSADHQNATAVSIPRDLVVPIPSCPKTDGSGSYSAMSAQPLNNAYSYGGLNCVVQTVKSLTGVDIPFAGLISFNGVIEMTNAIGGVPVCVNKPITDRYTGLKLAAGTTTLQGGDALAFLRSRHGVGDGSDLGRISSQQVYLSSMLRTIKSGGVLGSPTKLFKLASAATQNMSLSNSLNNVSTMIEIGLALKDLPLGNVNFVQYPGSTGGTGVYSGKVKPDTYTAGLLFDAIKNDQPFTIPKGSTGVGSVDETAGEAAGAAGGAAAGAAAGAATTSPTAGAGAGAATTTPTDGATASSGASTISGLTGQTAADQTCSVAYKF